VVIEQQFVNQVSINSDQIVKEGRRNCVFKQAWFCLRATIYDLGELEGGGLLGVAVLHRLSRNSSNPDLAIFHGGLTCDLTCLLLVPSCTLSDVVCTFIPPVGSWDFPTLKTHLSMLFS